MKSTLALSSAALLAVARAQEPIAIGEGAADISSDDWNLVTESANLTDSQTFTGRDISSAYPGEPQEGWEWSLALKDDLPAPEGDDVLTAAAISLSAPGEGDVEIDDSWRVCAHVFPVLTSSAGDGWGHEFEPNCVGLVAQECVDDLAKQARSNFGPDCPAWSITPSCLRDLEDGKGSSVSINADSSDLLGNTSFFRNVAGAHAADDDTLYLEATTRGYAVISVFGASAESEDEPYADVKCLLPQEVEGDSVDPGAPVEDAATSLSKFVGWAALTGAVAYQLL